MLASDKGSQGPELDQLCSNRKLKPGLSVRTHGRHRGGMEREESPVGAPLTQGGAPGHALFRAPWTRGTRGKLCIKIGLWLLTSDHYQVGHTPQDDSIRETECAVQRTPC